MNGRVVVLIGCCAFVMAACYLLFLAASWNAYQEDRAKRDEKINELLDRLKPKGPVIVVEGQ